MLVLVLVLLLTAVFTALGFWVAFSVGEAARGLAAALILWLVFSLVYDGVVLMASHSLAAYPLERPMLAAMLLNPVDLARVIAPEAKIENIGIRPGEKLHEMMISRDESRSTVELENMFVVQPVGTLWFRHDWSQEGTPTPDGFKYTSDNNNDSAINHHNNS